MNTNSSKVNRVCIMNPHGYVQYPPPLGKTDTGGQTTYILQLARALGKRNIKVDIITRRFEDKAEEEQLWENVKIVRIPAGPKTFVQKEKMYELIPELVENFMHYIERTRKKYDIIHSHYWDGGYGGILLSKMLDIPHVHTPHTLGKLKKLEMSVEELPPQKLKPAYRYHVRIAIEQKIYNSTNAIVVLCETSRIQMLQHYIIDFEKVHVIYSGIDTKYFNPEKTDADRKLHLKPNAILTASRLVPAKGLDRVIDALTLIKNRIDFHYYMVGGAFDEVGSNEEEATEKQLLELVKKDRLTERVTFEGIKDHDQEMPLYYRNSDIFILAGRYEPFGLTALEAMACGTAPIVSSVAGAKEVIIDGLNGFIVDTHDRKALSETIYKLLNDAKLRKKISENAAFTIKEHYSWEKIVEKFISLYKKLI